MHKQLNCSKHVASKYKDVFVIGDDEKDDDMDPKVQRMKVCNIVHIVEHNVKYIMS